MDNLIPFSPSQKADAKAICSRIDNELLSRREAAAYLGIAENTLAIWKSSGRHTPTIMCTKADQLDRRAQRDRG